MRRASWISFGISVTRFACKAQRLASSNRWTRYASAAYNKINTPLVHKSITAIYCYIYNTRVLLLSLSLLAVICPGGPGLAGTIMSPLWILLEWVVVTTGAISSAKLQSNHHQQQTNTQFFTGQMPFLSPNQQHQRTEGKI